MARAAAAVAGIPRNMAACVNRCVSGKWAAHPCRCSSVVGQPSVLQRFATRKCRAKNVGSVAVLLVCFITSEEGMWQKVAARSVQPEGVSQAAAGMLRNIGGGCVRRGRQGGAGSKPSGMW